RVLRAVTLDVERAGHDLALPLHRRAGLDHVAAAAGSAHLLGLSVVAAERADLDEVDVAGRVLRPGPRVVPDTRVVRDEVAGLYVQLLEVERVAGGDARPAFTRSEQLDGLLVAAVHAEDQLEGADPVVVLGADLDEHLVHGAGARVAAGLAQHDDGR